MVDQVTEAEMDEAADGDDEKRSLVELIMSKLQSASVVEDSSMVELRAELCALKLSILRKRARTCGVDEVAMETAVDGDDEKSETR